MLKLVRVKLAKHAQRVHQQGPLREVRGASTLYLVTRAARPTTCNGSTVR